MKTKTSIRGFTLIELLAVVAIILVLLGLLVPGLRVMRSKANIAVCKSNLRQLHVGMVGDMQTRNTSAFTPYQSGRLWMDDVAKNLGGDTKLDAIRFCPEATQISPGFARDSKHAWTWNSTTLNYGSYGLNGWTYHPNGGSSGANGGAGYYFGNADWPNGFWATLGEAGAKAPLFADSSWVDSWPFFNDAVPADLNVGLAGGNRPTYMGRFAISRHDNGIKLGINVVFCDGHADYVPLDMLWDLQWSKTFVRQGQKTPFP